MAANTDPYCRCIPWRVLSPDNVATRNATEAVARRHGCGYGSTLPLTCDVIGLVRIQSRPIRNVRASCKVGADVSDGDPGGKAKHAESGDEAQRIEDDDRASDPVLVGKVGGKEDRNDGIVVWWRGEEDCFIGTETHARLQDYWEEVGKCR